LANKSVTLVRKVKTPEGWRRYPVVMSANGKVKPNACLVADKEVVFRTGHYELRSYLGTKAVYERIEGTATDAFVALKAAQKKSAVLALADDAGVQVVPDQKRKSLRDEFPKFIQAARDRGSEEAAETYTRSVSEFLDGCTKVYVDEVVREDVTKFHVLMKKRGMAARTIHNAHMNLRAFLLYLGLDANTVAGKAPRYDKTLPDIYDPKELAQFFGAIDTEYDRVFFSLLLKTGLREREAMHLEWSDISFGLKTLHVKSKPLYGHRIKDAEERELTIPDDLLAALEAYRKDGHKLVFGKRGGLIDSPDGHLLRRLKRIAKKHKLSCGHCDGCSSKAECEKWFLHKFRATYCTTLLRSGLDLRTVQRLMGHSDLASTMRYLRPAGTSEVQDKVNAVAWF
jgi:integrase